MAERVEGEREGLRGRMAGKLRALKKKMQADRMTMPFQQQTSLDVLQRLLEQRGRENDVLQVIHLYPDLTLSEKLQMNRHSLLAECKRYVSEFSIDRDPSRSELLKQATSRSQGGDALWLDPSSDITHKLEGSRSHSTPTGLHTGSVSSHTSRSISRENRSKSKESERESTSRTGKTPALPCLQRSPGIPPDMQPDEVSCSSARIYAATSGCSDPVVCSRANASDSSRSFCHQLCICPGAGNNWITCKKAIFVFPDGDDSSLVQLQAKLREEPQDKQINLPFELKVLEAILLVFVQDHASTVDSCSQDCKVQLKSLKTAVTASMLNEMYVLKTRVAQAVQQVQVGKDELERVQKDDQLMALMNLTDMYNDTEPRLRPCKCTPQSWEFPSHSHSLHAANVAAVDSLQGMLRRCGVDLEWSDGVYNLRSPSMLRYPSDSKCVLGRCIDKE
eukprot:758784-Hanusia_phi.AAC.10